MGITGIALHPTDNRYLAGEAIRYLTGSLIPLPPMLLPMVDATGGWSASVVDMARFLTNLEGTRGTPVLNEKTRRLMIEPPPAALTLFVGPEGGWSESELRQFAGAGIGAVRMGSTILRVETAAIAAAAVVASMWIELGGHRGA